MSKQTYILLLLLLLFSCSNNYVIPLESPYHKYSIADSISELEKQIKKYTELDFDITVTSIQYIEYDSSFTAVIWYRSQNFENRNILYTIKVFEEPAPPVIKVQPDGSIGLYSYKIVSWLSNTDSSSFNYKIFINSVGDLNYFGKKQAKPVIKIDNF